jgi:hypothetical protein
MKNRSFCFGALLRVVSMGTGSNNFASAGEGLPLNGEFEKGVHYGYTTAKR